MYMPDAEVVVLWILAAGGLVLTPFVDIEVINRNLVQKA